MPSCTHLPVFDELAPVPDAAKSPPLGEPTWTSTLVVPVLDHESNVCPAPEPSHTLIGFGLATIVPRHPSEVVEAWTTAIVFASVNGFPPETSWR